MISTQAVLASDFLDKEKQILICHNDAFFRVNWEDFDKDGKAFHVRSKHRLKSYYLVIDKQEAADVYKIVEEKIHYDEKGEEAIKRPTVINLNSHGFIFESYPDRVSYHYIRTDLPDSELLKVCKI